MKGYSLLFSTILLIIISISIFTLLTSNISPVLSSKYISISEIYERLIMANQIELNIVFYIKNGNFHKLYVINNGVSAFDVKELIVNNNSVYLFNILDIEKNTYTYKIYPQKIYIITVYYIGDIYDIYIITQEGVKVKFIGGV